MKNPSILVVIGLILSACHLPATKDPAGEKDDRFHTTPPSHLYFKNIRSSNYEQQTQPGTRIDLYRLRRFSQTTDRPILYPVIADNWMQDEVYLLIRPNDFKVGFSDTLRVFWKSDRDSGRYELPLPNFSEQYRFAGQLYQSLQQKHRLTIETAAGNRAPLFENQEDRQLFLTTLRDYYRLTEKE